MSIKTSKRKRWAIQVVYANGDIAYLRRGPHTGFGPIVGFTSKLTAEINADMLREGLDHSDDSINSINVVTYPDPGGSR